MPVYSDLLRPAQAGPGAPPGPEQAPPTWSSQPMPAPQIPHQRTEIQPASPPSGPSSPAPTDGEASKSGPSVAVIVGLVLVGATVLVLGALGIPFALEKLRSDDGSTTYSVGDCVIQAGDSAEPADCSEPDAYEIVAQVDSREECEDPTQPAVEVEGPPAQFFCLAPAAEPEPEPEPTE